MRGEIFIDSTNDVITI